MSAPDVERKLYIFLVGLPVFVGFIDRGNVDGMNTGGKVNGLLHAVYIFSLSL